MVNFAVVAVMLYSLGMFALLTVVGVGASSVSTTHDGASIPNDMSYEWHHDGMNLATPEMFGEVVPDGAFVYAMGTNSSGFVTINCINQTDGTRVWGTSLPISTQHSYPEFYPITVGEEVITVVSEIDSLVPAPEMGTVTSTVTARQPKRKTNRRRRSMMSSQAKAVTGSPFLFAVWKKNGTLAWQTTPPSGNCPDCTAQSSQYRGLVYVVGGNVISALDARTGEMTKWAHVVPTSFTFSTAPLIFAGKDNDAKDAVVIGFAFCTVFAFSGGNTGAAPTMLWNFTVPHPTPAGFSTAECFGVIEGDTLFLTMNPGEDGNTGRVIMFDPRTGKVLNKKSYEKEYWGGFDSGVPLVFGTIVYSSLSMWSTGSDPQSYSIVFGVDAATGATVANVTFPHYASLTSLSKCLEGTLALTTTYSQQYSYIQFVDAATGKMTSSDMPELSARFTSPVTCTTNQGRLNRLYMYQTQSSVTSLGSNLAAMSFRVNVTATGN